MQLTGTEDLRVIKTIEAIKQSFEALICEKDYEKITVKELCEKARINKKTFYHYYSSLDDLLSEMQAELSAKYIDKVKNYILPDDLEQITREFFTFSANQSLAYEKITASGNYDYVRGRMISKVMNATWEKSERFNKLDLFKQSILISYVNTVTLDVYKHWMADGKKVPIDEIVDICNQLVLSGTKGFFENN